MLKFQSVFSPLMVIMFSLNQAALLCIQLLLMRQVFAVSGILTEEQRNIRASRGKSVILFCNISIINVTQINWKKGLYYFADLKSLNLTSSNFPSNINLSSPLKLSISNVQHDDAGLYTCELTHIKGPRTIQWNLTVSEEPEGSSASWFTPLKLTAVIGFILSCVFTSAVCIYRKFRSRTPNQNPVQDQFHLQSEEEMTRSQTQGGIRTNKRRSQYTERLNSIYGLY